jgi:hypothetical protein
MSVTAEPHTLTALLHQIEKRIDGDGPGPAGKVSIQQILDVVGKRAYGPILLIIGIMSVSPLGLIPGSTWTFAVLTLLVSAQMALNLPHPWLPAAALRASFSEAKIQAALCKVRPVTRVIDQIIRPRLQFLADQPWLMIVALLAIAAALITFPLSFIPLAPFLPGATIILIGLGITARDGLALGAAIAITGAAAFWIADRWWL